MGLIFRTSSLANAGATSIKNSPLTFNEGDGNFAWLAANLSASVVSISGAVSLQGSLSLPTITTTNQSNVVTINTSTGQLFYTASTAFGGGATISTSSLLVTASATNNVLTFTKGDNSTFNVTIATGSALNTGSFMITGSVSSNVLTFTKGDNTTFNLTVDTGSGIAISTASFMTTGSVSNNVLTFTKGDNSTFNLTVSTGSSSPISVAGTTLYSNNPSTSGFSQVDGIFLGSDAGKDAANANNSIFLGSNAGFGATGSTSSNFIGYFAGQNASAAGGSNFIGSLVGQNAISASNSTFIGGLAGGGATFASESIFIGNYAGLNAASASYSIFLGHYAGAKVGGGGAPGPGFNNIVIGNGIGFPSNTSHSINIGGVIFATGSVFNVGSAVVSPALDGKVGINKSDPQYNLEVSGSVGLTTLLNIAESHPLPAGSIGSMAVSASNLYFYSASAWSQVQLV